MFKRFLLGFVCLIFSLNGWGQTTYGYDPHVNEDNIIVGASLSFNSTAPLIHHQEGWSNTAKGAMSTVPAIGIYYHKSIGSRLSTRFGFSFGYTSNAFKYAQKYDSLTPDYSLKLTENFSNYVKVKTGTGYIQPQLDLGYIFGPIKDMYLIEIRAGIGFQVYLGKSNDSIEVTDGSVTAYKNTFTFKYHTSQSANYGNVDAFGSFVSNVYVGIKWQKTTNEFLNRFSLGIQATLPISNNYAGYAQLEYKDDNYNIISKEQVYLSQFSFGIKAAYNLIP